MKEDIKLKDNDPTIFTKCLVCSRTGKGVAVGTYLGIAFTPRQWKQNPTCPNCEGSLTKLYEVE